MKSEDLIRIKLERAFEVIDKMEDRATNFHNLKKIVRSLIETVKLFFLASLYILVVVLIAYFIHPVAAVFFVAFSLLFLLVHTGLI